MKRFKRLLCIVDPQRPADAVLRRAVSLARNNQATLAVVCVVPKMVAGIGMPEGGPISADLQAAATAASQQQLEEIVAPFRAQLAIDVAVLVGTPFLEIIRKVLRHGHDLVIKAPEDPGWLERLFGSDDMHLLRKCPCPVWLVKPAPSSAYRRILAAVDAGADGSDEALAKRHRLNVKILELAASLALSDFAELHVAHAWQAVGESALRGAFLSRPDTEVLAYIEQVRRSHHEGLDALLKAVIGNQTGDTAQFLSPTKHLIKGHPQIEIPLLAKNLQVDLVVMGTVARTGVPGFFIGNTAESILEQIECSVMAVKPEGFVTPVTVE